MKHMTLSEFIDSESDEPVFIVDGPQPMCATRDWATAEFWRQRAALYLALSSEPKLAEHDHPFIKAYGGPAGGSMASAKSEVNRADG